MPRIFAWFGLSLKIKQLICFISNQTAKISLKTQDCVYTPKVLTSQKLTKAILSHIWYSYREMILTKVNINKIKNVSVHDDHRRL